MKAANLLATLQRLGVIPSFSRPGVSNDNSYSESLFRTVKYCPPTQNTGLIRLNMHGCGWVNLLIGITTGIYIAASGL